MFRRARSRSLSSRLAVCGLASCLALAAAACGGSTETTTGEPENGAAGSSTAPAGPTPSSDLGPETVETPSVDVCSEVASDQVSQILDGVTITGAEPIPGVDGSCQYFVDIGGMEAAAVQIITYPVDYLEAQRELQTGVTDLPEVDGFLYATSSVMAPGSTVTVNVTAGVELTEGGSVASTEQLVAITELAQGL